MIVHLPTPVELKSAAGKPVLDEHGNADAPWPLSRFLTHFVFARKTWASPFSRLRMAGKCLDVVEAAEAAGAETVAVPDDVWRAVRDDIEAEDFTIPPPFGRQLYPLGAAWLEAKAE